MQSWSNLLSLLALTTTTTLAAPAGNYALDTDIRVTLANDGQGLATQTSGFTSGQRDAKRPIGTTGPFTSVELTLGKDVSPQTLRCKILDYQHNAIVIVRGENIDTTFSDADKGAWTFRDGAREVKEIVCSPKFEAHPIGGATPPSNGGDTTVTVQLSGPSELATQTNFALIGTGAVQSESLVPVGSPGPFNAVQLNLGAGVMKQDLRCRLTDEWGNVITLKRGESVQNTFSKGQSWTFLKPMESGVGAVECNDVFELGSP